MIRGTAIDLALELIETVREPDQRVTLDQIADVVNALNDEGYGTGQVRHQDIYFLERRAMKKLRKAMVRSDRSEGKKAILAGLIGKVHG
jgi:hypothetical protein